MKAYGKGKKCETGIVVKYSNFITFYTLKKKKSTQKKLDTCKKKEVKLGIYSLPNSGNTVMNYKPLDNAMIINDKK